VREGEGNARAEGSSIVPKLFVFELVPAGPHAMKCRAQADQGAREEEMMQWEVVAMKKSSEVGI
jgi:hypothetical protein